MITEYRVEVSRNGESFHSVAEGVWQPTASTKVATWDEAEQARYVRLVATGHVNDQASAAEIKVMKSSP